MNAREKKLIKKLADIIEANPKCYFSIDNDGWQIHISSEKKDDDMILLADSDDYKIKFTDWYGSGHVYGAALSEAMIELLNRRGFNITAESV